MPGELTNPDPSLVFAAGELAGWQRAWCRAFAPVTVTAPDPEDWTASLATIRLGSLQVTEESCAPATVVRGAEAVRAQPSRHVLARVQLAGSVRIAQDDRTTRLAEGELAFLDLGRPFVLANSAPQRARSLLVPRSLLGLDETALRRITASPVAEAGAGALLVPLLSGIGPELVRMPPQVRERLARSTADLLAALAAEHAGRVPTGARPGPPTPFERITAYVETQLGDPDLVPQQIADRHGISLRYLHQLFHREGQTVNGWIRGRRLAAAHQELAGAHPANRAVAAVAARWGFTSAAHFSRVFRAAYGMSPTQCREHSAGSAAVRAVPHGGARADKPARSADPRFNGDERTDS